MTEDTIKMTHDEMIDVLKGLVFGTFDRTTAKEREALDMAITLLEQEPKTRHCKNCKWWKDSDGKYRRGIRAESKCPLNTDVVYYGTGYCYMFEPITTKE